MGDAWSNSGVQIIYCIKYFVFTHESRIEKGKEFASALVHDSFNKYRICYLLSTHLFPDYTGFTDENGCLLADANSFVSLSKSSASKFYPHSVIVDYLNQLDEFYKKSILPVNCKISPILDTHKSLTSLREVHLMYQAKDEKFVNLRPCLLTNTYVWKEMCVLELFDDSFKVRVMFDRTPHKCRKMV